ncbi:MAG: septal ring lytic transglycosylase RlpA family protein [Gallionella sp.]
MNKQVWLWVSISLLLSACVTPVTPQQRPPAPSQTKYPVDTRYNQTPTNQSNNLVSMDKIPDAVPRYEPLHPSANNAYVQFNREYRPIQNADGFRQRGIASWYGANLEGSPTASGEPYNDYAMTAAHPTLPIPSYVRVTSAENGRSVIVRINDRGPFRADRIIHLSYVAAYKLGMSESRTAEVWLESITPNAPMCNSSQANDNFLPYNNIQPYNGVPIYDNSRPAYSSAPTYDNSRPYNSAPIYDNSRPYNSAPIYDNSRPYNNAPYYNNTTSPDAPLFTIQPNSR